MKQRDKNLETKFLAYHHSHPWVFDDLVRLTKHAKITALAVGRRRSGTKRHFEQLRYPNIFRLDGVPLNNNNSSRYARLIQNQVRPNGHEHCKGCTDPNCLSNVFELRKLRTSSHFDITNQPPPDTQLPLL